jgi:hypothetical protein
MRLNPFGTSANIWPIVPAPDHYATSRKIVGSIPDEVNEFFFSICLILPAALGSGVYSASNRNEYQN